MKEGEKIPAKEVLLLLQSYRDRDKNLAEGKRSRSIDELRASELSLIYEALSTIGEKDTYHKHSGNPIFDRGADQVLEVGQQISLANSKSVEPLYLPSPKSESLNQMTKYRSDSLSSGETITILGFLYPAGSRQQGLLKPVWPYDDFAVVRRSDGAIGIISVDAWIWGELR